MTQENKPQILLTNDDGIDSPGLWAAAEALSEIGYVWVVAPREQSSAAGRSMPPSSDGLISTKTLNVHGVDWVTYAVGGTPAQTVQHGLLEVMGDVKPDLVVAGINYGVNLGAGITVSGTVGAAMEGAAHGIPSLAVSLETAKEYHLTYSSDIDFSAAAYFTKYFGQMLLERQLDPALDVLKIDVPASATTATPWAVTRLSLVRFYIPLRPQRTGWDVPSPVDYTMAEDMSAFPEDSDVYTVLAKKQVSVTPIQMDMTARLDFKKLAADLK